MRIRVVFGYAGKEYEFGWFRDLMDFPHLLRFEGSVWEWTMNASDPRNQVDKVLHFAKVYNYVPNPDDIPDFEKTFSSLVKFGKCQCGAKYTSFPQFHMQFCPEYGKKKEYTPPPDDEL